MPPHRRSAIDPQPDLTLSDRIREEIRVRGPIPFREFMERALYEPGLGYYAVRDRRIGRKGDFFTNVSVGPLFGALLARQFLEIRERLGNPRPFTLVEQGAHHGQLMADVLAAWRGFAPGAEADCAFIEPLPHLREAQAAAMAGLAQPRWVSAPEELEPFCGVHFSNELVDAFPVHRVVRRDGRWIEQHVGWAEGERFVFRDGPLSTPELAAAVGKIGARAEGCETEINPAAGPWMSAIAGRIERGAVIVIDYGFSREDRHFRERTAGTLQARAAHRIADDPLDRPGSVDLTAHVDFTALADAGLGAGLKIAGFTDQHHFLVGLSRGHFPDGERPGAREMREFQTLTHPTMLGRSFKVLAMTRELPGAPPLSGFAFGSDAGRLVAQPRDIPMSGGSRRRTPQAGAAPSAPQ